jgi:hypothetical protein
MNDKAPPTAKLDGTGRRMRQWTARPFTAINNEKRWEALNMERQWILDVLVDNPQHWVVAANVGWESGKGLGDIVLVTTDEKAAVAKAKELKDRGDMGMVSIREPYDDRPQIGGLTVV